MTTNWKPGVRAVFVSTINDKPRAQSRSGKKGTVQDLPWKDSQGDFRVHFVADDGDKFLPMIRCLHRLGEQGVLLGSEDDR